MSNDTFVKIVNKIEIDNHKTRSPNKKAKLKVEPKLERYAVLTNGSTGIINYETNTHYSIEVGENGFRLSAFIPKEYVESTNFKSNQNSEQNRLRR